MKGNILKVFLASPGGLDEERQTIREEIEHFNRIIGKNSNWQIVLFEWKDTLPGVGRPQDLINPDVKSCDLFIGIIADNWGSPTGKYASGFYEEFSIAKELNLKIGRPEIWLFFKIIEPNRIKDPGPELQKVLDFKRDLIERKEIKFSEFRDLQFLRNQIYDWFIVYTSKISAMQSVEEEPTRQLTFKGKKPIRKSLYVPTKKSSKLIPKELSRIFTTLYARVPTEGPEVLKTRNRARLSLLATSWISKDSTNEILSIHQINVHYRYGTKWNLTSHEKWLITRSIIGDTYNTRPGWRWFRDWKDELFSNILLKFSIEDGEADVRRGAFSLLANAGFCVPGWYIKNGIQDKDDGVILQAIRLFKFSEEKSNLNLLQPLVDSNSTFIRDAAISTRIGLLFSQNPDGAFSELIALDVLSSIELYNLTNNMDLNKVNKDLVMNGLKKGTFTLRSIVAQYLRKSKLLSKEICIELLNDKNPDVRKEALIALVELGEEVDLDTAHKHLSGTMTLADDIRTLILKKRDFKSLISNLDFYYADGYIAYHVLAIAHFIELKDKIRKDLDDNFESLRHETEDRLRQVFGSRGEEIIRSIKPDLVEYMRSKFIKAGISGLAINGTREDKKYAWKYLGSTQYGMADGEAIKIIEKFGDPSDAEKLFNFATTSKGEFKKLSTKVALKLSPGIDGILPKLLKSTDLEILGIGISGLSQIQSSRSVKLAKSFLYHENDDIRLKALSVLIQQCDREFLEQLLIEYQEKLPYYYNVVTWLDRYLYAPGRFGKFFKNRLTSMIDDLGL